LLLVGLLAAFLSPVAALAAVSEQMSITGLYLDSAGQGEPLDLAYGATSKNTDPNNIVLADDSVAVPTIKFYKNASNEWETVTYVAGFRCCYLDDSVTHQGSGTTVYGSVGQVFPDGTDNPDTACDYLYYLTPAKKNNKLQWTAQAYTASGDGEQTLELKDADNNPIVEITSNAAHVKSAYGADDAGVWEQDGKQYHVVYSKITPKNAGTLTVCIRGLEFGHGGYATPYYFVKIEVVDEQAPAEPEVTQIDVPTAKTSLVYNGAEQRGVSVGEGYDLENATATDAGTYQAVAKLREGYAWTGGSTEDQSIEWSIDKAQLQATYKSETVRPDEEPEYAVTYSGWKGSDSADNAADFVAPTITGPENLGVNTTHTLTPEGGSAKNYYFTYWKGILTVLKYAASLTAGDNVGKLQNDLVAGGEAVSVDVGYIGRQDATAEDARVNSYARQAGNIVSYDSSSILEASYDPSTGQLTVTPLAVGECMLTITVAGDEAYDQVTSGYINVSITEAEKQDASLAIEDGYESKLAGLKAGGDPVDIEVTYAGRSDVAQADETVEPDSSDIAVVSYDIVAGKLTIEPTKAGAVDFTVSVAGDDSYNGVSLTVSVNVAEADEEPPAGIEVDDEYELTIGGDPVTISYDGELDFTLSEEGVVSVEKSADGKTLTVSPVAVGQAIMTVAAVGTTLDPVTVGFTVKEADGDNPQEKGTIALEPMTVAAGASKSGNLSIKDADGNVVESGINVSSSDDAIATATYENGKLTVTGVAEGTATVTLSSDALDDDYTIEVTVTARQESPGDSSSDGDGASGDGSSDATGGDGDGNGSGSGNEGSGDGASGSGGSDGDGAGLSVVFYDASQDGVKADYSGLMLTGASDVRIVANGVASDSEAFKKLKEKATGTLLAVYSVSMTVDGAEVHDGFGALKVSFPVDNAYEGKEVVVWHLHHDGTITSEKTIVSNGFATVSVTDLSELSVETGTNSSATTNNSSATTSNKNAGTTTTGTTSGSNLSKTGDDSMALVWGGLGVIVIAGVAGFVLARRSRRETKSEDGKAV